MALALKVQHRVNDVLHHLWSCDGAVLIDMTHYDNGYLLIFRGVHEQVRTLSDLRETSGTGGYPAYAHGLDRVDYRNVGSA